MDDARSFQTHRLAAGIRPRNHQDMTPFVELQIERHHLLALRPERLLQQGMPRIAQHQPVVRRNDRFHRSVGNGPAGFGTDHIQIRKIVADQRDPIRFGANRVGEGRKYPHDLAPLGVLQLLEFVIDFDNLDRLDVEGLARGRFVVDETLQLAFIGRCDRNHRPAVADREHRVGLHDTGFLGIRQHLLQAFGGLPLPFEDHPPDLLQLRRSVVPNLAVLIDDTVDRPNDLRESLDPPAAEPQFGI